MKISESQLDNIRNKRFEGLTDQIDYYYNLSFDKKLSTQQINHLKTLRDTVCVFGEDGQMWAERANEIIKTNNALKESKPKNMKKKISESQLHSIICEAIKKTLQETPQFEKGWNDDMKRERRTANFVDDVFGNKTNPYDLAPEFGNAVDTMMNNGRIAKHKTNRGSKKIKESIDWFHENNSPSPLEEEFEDALYNVVDQYKDEFLSKGFTTQDLAKWCCEIINKALS